MHDQDRIRFVTGHYYDLQGLRSIIAGIMCGFVAAEDPGWISKGVLLFAVLPIGIALLILTVPYYWKTYGMVLSPRISNAAAAVQMLGWAAFLGAIVLDQAYEPALFLTPLGFAAWLAAQYLSEHGSRPHYLAAAISLAVLDLLLWAWPPPATSLLARGDFVTWLLIGMAFIVTGMLDHQILSRAMRPGPPEAGLHV